MKLAAIDIGSNAIRLMITNVFEEDNALEFKKETLIRVPLRLGEEAFIQGKISDAKVERLLKSLSAFKLLMEVFCIEEYRACATSAMREAENGAAVIARIKEGCNINLELIDGIEESKLIFSGLEDFLEKEALEHPLLSIDVGGGSTETVLIIDNKIAAAHSWKVGTLRLKNETVEQSEWDAMQAWLNKLRDQHEVIYSMGSGGNINKIRKMYVPNNERMMKLDSLKNVQVHLSGFTQEELVLDLELKPDRADVIVPAANIFINVMTWSGSNRIYIPNRGLADGIARDLFLKRLGKQHEG